MGIYYTMKIIKYNDMKCISYFVVYLLLYLYYGYIFYYDMGIFVIGPGMLLAQYRTCWVRTGLLTVDNKYFVGLLWLLLGLLSGTPYPAPGAVACSCLLKEARVNHFKIQFNLILVGDPGIAFKFLARYCRYQCTYSQSPSVHYNLTVILFRLIKICFTYY